MDWSVTRLTDVQSNMGRARTQSVPAGGTVGGFAYGFTFRRSGHMAAHEPPCRQRAASSWWSTAAFLRCSNSPKADLGYTLVFKGGRFRVLSVKWNVFEKNHRI